MIWLLLVSCLCTILWDLQAPEEVDLGLEDSIQLFLMADSISGLDQQYSIPIIVDEASDSDSDSDSSSGSGSNSSGSDESNSSKASSEYD